MKRPLGYQPNGNKLRGWGVTTVICGYVNDKKWAAVLSSFYRYSFLVDKLHFDRFDNETTGTMLTTLSGTYRAGTIILDESPLIDYDVPVLVTFLAETVLPQAAHKGVRLGSWEGKYSLPDSFNDPLDDLAEYM